VSSRTTKTATPASQKLQLAFMDGIRALNSQPPASAISTSKAALA